MVMLTLQAVLIRCQSGRGHYGAFRALYLLTCGTYHPLLLSFAPVLLLHRTATCCGLRHTIPSSLARAEFQVEHLQSPVLVWQA